ncbi:MAG: hypothetical protein K8R74_04515 [Bacteroidales bacterium]|nr:hypothetical protein [Bacteroidales bacterium]
MDYYQPYSLLFTHSTAPKTLQINTMVFVPGNQNLKVNVTPVSGSTTIKIYAILSSVEQESRWVEVIEELTWDGATHIVYTEVYDLSTTLVAKNALHTTGATQY